MELQLQNEPLIRLTAFAAVLGSLVVLERFFPRRKLGIERRKRWPSNFGILALNTAALRLVVPLGAVGIAIWAESRDWGLFNRLEWPHALEIGLGVVLLDLAIYGQHVLFHHCPPLWRLHRMHHSDTDVDVSTGNRFHTIEILLSMGIKAPLAIGFGLAPLSVLIFEIVLNAGSMFTHSNVRLPARVDRAVRMIFVTPDMHRVHHSIHRKETDSNFGFNLSLWDRIFRTYRPAPADGHEQMLLGVAEFRDPAEQRIVRLIWQPFRSGKG